MAVRSTELEQLQSLYEERDNNLVFVYGRSKMEQVELMNQFTLKKKSVFYSASECSNDMQREFFGKCISDSCDVSILQNDYESLFNRIKSGDETKLVLIVHHVERIMKKNSDFFEAILKLKAKKLYPGPVMIILMSESLVFAEQDLEGLLKNQMKKFDKIIKISELKFLDVVRKFPSFTTSQSVEVYGILGGVPGYLNHWDAKKTMKENVCKLVLDKNGPMHNEAHQYLAAELREYGVYQTILSSIASGKEKLNDIFHYTGYSRPKISVYMKNLAAFEVISKVSSFETGGWDNTKKGVYRISNTFLNFYYRFVFPYQSQLETMKPEAFYDKYIEPEIDGFLNLTFQKVCMEFLQLSSAVHQLPIEIVKIGTWIGKQGTIDIIAQDKIRNTIVGMCSWAEDSFTYDMYKELLDNMAAAKVKSDYRYLFSAKKFDETLLRAANLDPRIIIVDMNEM
ncbi:MAG: ATP-binding protein [Lachnospiraceae bacterium]|nr:ATP-binding protein [Lachnospiraceae bacterium]